VRHLGRRQTALVDAGDGDRAAEIVDVARGSRQTAAQGGVERSLRAARHGDRTRQQRAVEVEVEVDTVAGTDEMMQGAVTDTDGRRRRGHSRVAPIAHQVGIPASVGDLQAREGAAARARLLDDLHIRGRDGRDREPCLVGEDLRVAGVECRRLHVLAGAVQRQLIGVRR